MRVVRYGQSQQLLQVDLPWRGRQQVGASHDVGDFLFCVVHDHGELIREQAVGTTNHEIADIG